MNGGLFKISANFFAAIALLSLGNARDFTVTFLHNNDLHSHAEPVKVRGVELGGYARVATAIKQLRAKNANTVVVNAGDMFQGTLYFNVYQGLAEAAFLNQVGYDVMALGNHEFDSGFGVLADFIKLLSFPAITSNMDFGGVPELKDLVKPSTVVTIKGQKIGFVGAMLPSLADVTMGIVGPEDRAKMLPLQATVQAEVDVLTKQGINKIVVVSHCGFDIDQNLAVNLKDVDVIIGGHTHTLLGDIGIEGVAKGGEYPTVVKAPAGGNVLVVQSWEWGKVLGQLNVTFDKKGMVKGWKGSMIHPITNAYAEDPAMKALVAALGKPLEEVRRKPAGTLLADLERGTGGISSLGNVIADSMLAKFKSNGAQLAFMNQGGVRGSLAGGAVNYGQMKEIQPFGNTMVLLDLTGAELKTAFRQGAKTETNFTLIPSGNVQVTFNPGLADSAKVKIRLDGVEIEDGKTYRVVLNNFIAGGGDGILAFKEAKGTRVDTGFLDVDVFVEYVIANSPLKVPASGRIVVVKP